MNKDQKRSLIITGVAVLIVIVILGGFFYNNSKPGEYDQFAQCLSDKGLKFYGAFWCPHCQAQKAEFGNSKSKLPYIECSTPDGQGTTQICKDHDIKGFPTWIYPDGTRTEGEQSLADLSAKSGCPLPAGADTTVSSTTGQSSAAQ